MSNIVVQIGQCGNQVGFQLCDLLLNEIPVNCDTVFNQATRKARWIMVDSEPKVIGQVMTGKTTPLQTAMNPERMVYHMSGRGNNWAMGYMDAPLGGVSLHESTMEMVRREAESADYLRSILSISSLAGGTGSGLGSRIHEAIREEYPLIHLLACTVQPSSSGESPLQHYNSCFALSALLDSADTIFYFQNDEIMNTILANRQYDANVSMTNLNEYIACALYNLLYPERNRDLALANIVQNVCPSQDCKFVEVFTSPFLFEKQPTLPFETQWATLVDNCLGQHTKFEDPRAKNFEVLSIAASATYRGRDVLPDAEMPKKQFKSKLRSYYKPVSFLSSCQLADTMVTERPYNLKFRIERSITLASTRTGVILPIKRTYESAYAKFNAGAYLHWYTKYNCGRDEFMQTFDKIQGLVDTYEQLGMYSEGQRRSTNCVNDLFDSLLRQSEEERAVTVRNWVPNKEREYLSGSIQRRK